MEQRAGAETEGGEMNPTFKITNIETGYTWFTDDETLANRLSYENDVHDVETLETSELYGTR